jgi:phosphohistidine phosphatase
MKTLYILRHAESRWADTDVSDFDRPLNERGLQTAPLIGELMAAKRLFPGVIISSPARRARDTAVLLKQAGNLNASLTFDDQIYEASAQNLLNLLTRIDDGIDSALLVGHNPGIEGLIRLLTGRIEPMPTAALAVIDLIIESWTLNGTDTGDLRSVIRPRELMEGAARKI